MSELFIVKNEFDQLTFCFNVKGSYPEKPKFQLLNNDAVMIKLTKTQVKTLSDLLNSIKDNE